MSYTNTFANPHTYYNANGDSYSDTHGNGYAHFNSYTYTHSYCYTNPNTDSYANSNLNSNSDSYSYPYPNANRNRYSHRHTYSNTHPDCDSHRYPYPHIDADFSMHCSEFHWRPVKSGSVNLEQRGVHNQGYHGRPNGPSDHVAKSSCRICRLLYQHNDHPYRSMKFAIRFWLFSCAPPLP